MQRTIDETDRRREKQLAYNIRNGIVPKTVNKSKEQILGQTAVLQIMSFDEASPYAVHDEAAMLAAEDVAEYASAAAEAKTIPQMEKAIAKVKREMEKSAKDLDFMEAARLRDLMFAMERELGGMKK